MSIVYLHIYRFLFQWENFNGFQPLYPSKSSPYLSELFAASGNGFRKFYPLTLYQGPIILVWISKWPNEMMPTKVLATSPTLISSISTSYLLRIQSSFFHHLYFVKTFLWLNKSSQNTDKAYCISTNICPSLSVVNEYNNLHIKWKIFSCSRVSVGVDGCSSANSCS